MNRIKLQNKISQLISNENENCVENGKEIFLAKTLTKERIKFQINFKKWRKKMEEMEEKNKKRMADESKKVEKIFQIRLSEGIY